jgi:imidazolonepropionase-like amidohydrolase
VNNGATAPVVVFSSGGIREAIDETPTADFQGSAEQQVTIVKAARLIDGRGGAPLTPAMVRIEGDRIAAVGARLEVSPDARVIDLGHSTLLPGLIDLYTHLTDKFGIHWEEALVTTTPSQAALWGARNACDTLLAGFTTCRDMGPTRPYVDVDLRDAIEQGAVPGPRLLVPGNYVSATGGGGRRPPVLHLRGCPAGAEPGGWARRGS